MSLKTKVKVGNITNLSDARYCAGMGVDLLGFPIGNKANQITLDQFKEITEWVSGPEFVFETGDSIDQELLKKVTEMEIVQHVQASLNTLDQVQASAPKSILLSMAPSSWAGIKNKIKSFPISYILLQDESGIHWDEVEHINNQIPILLDDSFLHTGIEELLQKPISGIALVGSEEVKPGQKEYDHLAEVLEVLDVD